MGVAFKRSINCRCLKAKAIDEETNCFGTPSPPWRACPAIGGKANVGVIALKRPEWVLELEEAMITVGERRIC